jgi:hypothetical protein
MSWHLMADEKERNIISPSYFRDIIAITLIKYQHGILQWRPSPPYPTLSYPILPYAVLSYPILSCPILPILPYPILSYPTPSYPTLPYSTFQSPHHPTLRRSKRHQR